MKRKILSLILVLMLLPVASLFSACTNKGYNLNNLQNDFNAIKTENEYIVCQNEKYVFDYSNHSSLNAVMEFQYPYVQIHEYNKVYENSMAFAFNYIDECSNNSAVKDESIKNAIKKDLDSFKAALHDVDTYVRMLAEIVNVSAEEDLLEPACMARLENLFYSYEALFKSAINFNTTLADLYFNHIIADGNPNVYAIGVQNFDPNTVINLFDARLKYQIVNLSACYVEMYVDGANLSELIVNDGYSFDLSTFDYEERIDRVGEDFDELVAFQKADNASNKAKYFELSVQAYNIQTVLENDRAKFMSACENVAYAKFDSSDANAIEKLSVEIIDYRFELVIDYYNILVKMLEITGA